MPTSLRVALDVPFTAIKIKQDFTVAEKSDNTGLALSADHVDYCKFKAYHPGHQDVEPPFKNFITHGKYA